MIVARKALNANGIIKDYIDSVFFFAEQLDKDLFCQIVFGSVDFHKILYSLPYKKIFNVLQLQLAVQDLAT